MGVFWRAERFGLFSRKKYSAKSHKYRESAKQKERQVEGYYHNFAQLSSIPTELDVPSCQMQPSLRSKMYHCIWSRHTYNLLYLQTRAHLYTGKSTAPIATGPKKLINNFPPPPPPKQQALHYNNTKLPTSSLPGGGKEDRQDEKSSPSSHPFILGDTSSFFRRIPDPTCTSFPRLSEHPQEHHNTRDVQAPSVGDADNRTTDSGDSPPARLLEGRHKSRLFHICTCG